MQWNLGSTFFFPTLLKITIYTTSQSVFYLTGHKRHVYYKSATQVCCTLWVFSLTLLNNYLLVLVNVLHFVFQVIIVANNHNPGIPLMWIASSKQFFPFSSLISVSNYKLTCVSYFCLELTRISTLVKKHSLVCCMYIYQLNE